LFHSFFLLPFSFLIFATLFRLAKLRTDGSIPKSTQSRESAQAS